MSAQDSNRRTDAGPRYHPVGLGGSHAPDLTETESPRRHLGSVTGKLRLTKKPRPQQGKPQAAFSGWKLELLACLVFLAALGAIVATIYPYQGKPLPQWPLGVSVNTLLAIYGGVMKATMIYVVGSCVAQLQWSWFSPERPLIDLSRLADLSHGDIPGAFRWLWSNHIRQPLITLGAVVVIASIALEPFIQQLTSYVDCSVPVENLRVAPSMPRTNYIVQRSGVSSAMSGDPEIAQAILSGLVGSPDTLTSSGCTTGNCTFSKPYTSAGICSTCEDISSNITITKTCRRENGSVVDCDNATHQESVVWADRITSVPFDSYGLTNVSWTPMRAESQLFRVDTRLYPQWRRFVIWGIELVWGQTTYSQEKVNPLTMEPLQGCGDPSTKNTWPCRGYGSANCTLRFCTRTYKASVEAGVLVEKVIEESPSSMEELVNPPETPTGVSADTLGLLDLHCINDVELRELRKIGYNISSASPRWAAYVVGSDLFQLGGDKYNDIGPDSPFPQSLLSHRCLYMMSPVIQTNWFYVAAALSGNVSTGCIQNGCSTVGPKVRPNVQPFSSLSGDGGPVLLYNNSKVDIDDLSAKFSHVATHMTTMLRQTGNVNHSAPAEGEEFHYATCVNVHWLWIILPSVIAGCVLALLITVALLTAYDGTPLWKADVLALIFHGPGGAGWSGMPMSDVDGDKELSELNTSQGMERRAREIKVRLDQSSDLVQLLEAREIE